MTFLSKTGGKGKDMRTVGSKRDTTWPAIRGAAIRLIHQHGFDGMNVRLLASEAGLQPGSLYNYFKSKEDLLSMIVCEIMEDLLDLITDALEDCTDPVERFARFVEVMAIWHMKHKQEAFIAHMEMRSLARDRYDEYVDLRGAFGTILKGIVSDGVKAKQFDVLDLDITTISLLSTLAAIPNWYQEKGRLKGPALAQWHVQAALRLVGANVQPQLASGTWKAVRRETSSSAHKSARSAA